MNFFEKSDLELIINNVFNSDKEIGGRFIKKNGKLTIDKLVEGNSHEIKLPKGNYLFHTHNLKNSRKKCNYDIPSMTDFLEIAEDRNFHFVFTPTFLFIIEPFLKNKITSYEKLFLLEKKFCNNKIDIKYYLNELLKFGISVKLLEIRG